MEARLAQPPGRVSGRGAVTLQQMRTLLTAGGVWGLGLR